MKNNTIKNNTASQTSQQKTKAIDYSSFMSHCRLKDEVNFLNRTESSVLDVLMFLQSRGMRAYISQEGIARRIGIGREHCNRVIRKLCEMGFMAKISQARPVKGYTCTYFVNPGFFGIFRYVFSKQFPALRGLLLVMLVPLMYVTQSKDNGNINSFRFGRYTTDSRYCQESPNEKQKSFQEERRVAMKRKLFYQVYGNDPYGKAIRMVNDVIPLTEFGKIKLSAFPEKILMQSLSALLESAVPIKNPVLWLFKASVSRCHHAGIIPNWEWMQQLMRDYGMSKDQGLELSVNNARFVPVVEVKKKEVSSTGKPLVYKQDVGGLIGDSRKVYVPEERPERNVIEEYLKYEQYRTTDEYKACCKALGGQIKNPFLESILSMNLPAEEYARLGITPKGEAVCPSSTLSLENPVQRLEPTKQDEMSGHPINSIRLTGTFTSCHSVMNQLLSTLSTSISRSISFRGLEQKENQNTNTSQPTCPQKMSPSSGPPFSQTS